MIQITLAMNLPDPIYKYIYIEAVVNVMVDYYTSYCCIEPSLIEF